MIDSEFFYTLAEVAVAFVGFSAIVAALRQRESGLSTAERSYMKDLVERSLAVVGFSLIPTLFDNLGFTTEESIKVSSIFLGIYIAVLSGRSVAYHLSHPLVIRISTFWARIGLSFVVVIQQILNGFGINGGHLVGGYMIGCLLLLVSAGLVFVAMLQAEHNGIFEREAREKVNALGKPIEDSTG